MTHPLTDLARRLDPGRVSIGAFLVTGDPMLAEACAFIGLDWVVVDLEAGPLSNRDTLHVLQALSVSSLLQIVRVPALDRHAIEHALDLGAHGVLVPKVESAAEARAAVEACYYPPRGRRGVNPIRASGYFSNLDAYFAKVDARTVCAVQIETIEGLAAAEEIAAVDGVEVVFVGTGDLASSLGAAGRPGAPEVRSACTAIGRAARTHGKVAGIFAYDLELASAYVDEGFRFIGLGNEVKWFLQGASDIVAAFRTAHPDAS